MQREELDLNDLALYRIYFRNPDLTLLDLEYDAGLAIESTLLQIERGWHLELLVEVGWLEVDRANRRFQLKPGAEPAFRGWCRSGGGRFPWERRLTRTDRRSRRVARALLSEWEQSGAIVGRLPPLVRLHPSRRASSDESSGRL